MTRSLLLAIIAPLVMVGVLFITLSRHDATTVRDTSTKPLAVPEGTWLAKGVVESSRGSGDQPAGTKLTRRWVFFTRCTGGRCAPWLNRESADAQELAPLARVDNGLLAVFTRRTLGCNTQETAELKRTFRITAGAAGGSLQASEGVRGVYPGCTLSGRDGQVLASLTWTVTRVSPTCPGLQDCREQR